MHGGSTFSAPIESGEQSGFSAKGYPTKHMICGVMCETNGGF
ncbi:hypothetical protein AtDm6_1949 [Acetobacter tropicalis]|uniref:Uncharacterized protein n=1 Tax=Acetobacter tropicalis TaxID=104102 RepID=A0A094YLZ2_9PROT|nr:hypothetical protein AtDm6_1949 [Acetobacter tropicalis]